MDNEVDNMEDHLKEFQEWIEKGVEVE